MRAAARAAAAGYREDIRTSLVAERQQAAADLQAQIDASVVGSCRLPTRTDAERNVILDQIRSLQGRLTELQADNTNLVKQLQPEPGVASSTPSPAADIAAGVLGGAVLGILLAILLGALDTRLRTARDVQQRLGLATLADFEPRPDAVDPQPPAGQPGQLAAAWARAAGRAQDRRGGRRPAAPPGPSALARELVGAARGPADRARC